MVITGAGGIRKEALVGWVRAASEPGLERSPPGEPTPPRSKRRGPSRSILAIVAKAGDIPSGELVAFNVEGTQVAVANVDGTFYAFDDTCTHARCSLSRGYLDGTSVTCPCHGSVFDVTTGAVLAPPAVEPVRSYRARVERAALQVEV
jgi:nitrite reductase/ring-hydroxylating ferredoxin subunit